MSDRIAHSVAGSTLADILERVLDKGVVVAGDIKICVADVELLSIKIRLLVASVDRALEMGVNWWVADPHLSAPARAVKAEQQALQERVAALERRLALATAVPEGGAL